MLSRPTVYVDERREKVQEQYASIIPSGKPVERADHDGEHADQKSVQYLPAFVPRRDRVGRLKTAPKAKPPITSG